VILKETGWAGTNMRAHLSGRFASVCSIPLGGLVLGALFSALVVAVGVLSGALPAAAASAVDPLYTVGVDVPSRSLEDRRSGAAAGLSTMLTRLSGLTRLPNSQALRAARRAPDRFYSQYRYFNTDRYDDMGQPLTQLRLQFSPRALRSLLSEAQLPLWTLNRPRVALWLAERSANGTQLVSDPEHPVLAAVLGRADYRGLPVVVGQSGVSATSVWNRDQTALRRASDAELMLVGRVQDTGAGDWQVRWTSWNGGKPRNSNKTGLPEVVATPGIDTIADALVNQFTVAGGEAGLLELVVENVNAVDDYAKLLQYLDALSYVESVSVGSLAGDELTLQVRTASTAEKFMRFLAVDSRLVASTRPRAARSLPTTDANSRVVDLSAAGADRELGSRSAIAQGEIADSQLRVAWQG